MTCEVHLELKPSSPFPHSNVLPFQGYFSHSFQGSFFLENLRKPRDNGQLLERTMVGKNGESTPRALRELDHGASRAELAGILSLCENIGALQSRSFPVFDRTANKFLYPIDPFSRQAEVLVLFHGLNRMLIGEKPAVDRKRIPLSTPKTKTVEYNQTKPCKG